MKTLVTVIFNGGGVPWRTLQAIFEKCDLADEAARGRDPVDVYIVSFDAASPALACLFDELKSVGLTWTLRRENVYDEEELRAAPLLRLVVDRAPKGTGGPRSGTEYDLSRACTTCGSGAVQVSPLRLMRSELPKTGPIYETFTGEVLVSERLRDALSAIEPAGLEMREVVDAKAGAGVAFFQLLSPSLPPMDPATQGLLREGQCPDCRRDGHFDSMKEPMRIVYRRTDLPDALLDAHSTYERFGNSKLRTPLSESNFAPPLLLVSPRIYEVMTRERVPRLKFEPVSVV